MGRVGVTDVPLVRQTFGFETSFFAEAGVEIAKYRGNITATSALDNFNNTSSTLTNPIIGGGLTVSCLFPFVANAPNGQCGPALQFEVTHTFFNTSWMLATTSASSGAATQKGETRASVELFVPISLDEISRRWGAGEIAPP